MSAPEKSLLEFLDDLGGEYGLAGYHSNAPESLAQYFVESPDLLAGNTEAIEKAAVFLEGFGRNNAHTKASNRTWSNKKLPFILAASTLTGTALVTGCMMGLLNTVNRHSNIPTEPLFGPVGGIFMAMGAALGFGLGAIGIQIAENIITTINVRKSLLGLNILRDTYETVAKASHVPQEVIDLRMNDFRELEECILCNIKMRADQRTARTLGGRHKLEAGAAVEEMGGIDTGPDIDPNAEVRQVDLAAVPEIGKIGGTPPVWVEQVARAHRELGMPDKEPDEASLRLGAVEELRQTLKRPQSSCANDGNFAAKPQSQRFGGPHLP